jgi:hypothetical protein
MRKISLLSSAALLLIAGVAFAAIDLKDFDDDGMKAIQDTKKDLESNIAGQDAPAVAEGAEFIRAGLQSTEAYFTKKGNVDDAVQWAKQGQEYAAAIGKAAGSNDFDAASTAFNGLIRTCKKCHDAYKPPDL